MLILWEHTLLLPVRCRGYHKQVQGWRHSSSTAIPEPKQVIRCQFSLIYFKQ